MAKYEDYTYNAKNLLRRFSHRIRFKKSLSSIKQKHINGKRTSVLDFGCGDGLFLNKLNSTFPNSFDLLGYEPYTEILEYNQVNIVESWDSVSAHIEENDKFDYICCFEVLEHLTTERQDQTIRQILAVLKENGSVIISVPIEKGLPVMVKGLLRRKGGGRWLEMYSWKNMFASLLGKPVSRFLEKEDYLTHFGFYFTDLENLLKKYFTIEKRYYSPIGTNFYIINSQVFYKLSPIKI